jgi:hypothetical protein
MSEENNDLYLIIDEPFKGMVYGVGTSEEHAKTMISKIRANGYSRETITVLPVKKNEVIDYNSTFGKMYFFSDNVQKANDK